MTTAQFQFQGCRISGFRFLKLTLLLSLLLLSSLGFGQTTSGLKIPSHPRELKFPKLNYDPPKAAKYRNVLSNGVVAFLAEDHDLPLVNMAVLVRTGSYLDPKGKEGLAAMSASQMRSGGTTHMNAETFDEE